MKRAQPRLRNKLLALLLIVGGAAPALLLVILVAADRQLFDRFLPENRAMRDIEARSALLVQNYYRFMLTPDHISVDEMTSATGIILQQLAKYRQLVAGDEPRQQLADSISICVDRLDQAGQEPGLARLRRGFARSSRTWSRMASSSFPPNRARVSKSAPPTATDRCSAASATISPESNRATASGCSGCSIVSIPGCPEPASGWRW